MIIISPWTLNAIDAIDAALFVGGVAIHSGAGEPSSRPRPALP